MVVCPLGRKKPTNQVSKHLAWHQRIQYILKLWFSHMQRKLKSPLQKFVAPEGPVFPTCSLPEPFTLSVRSCRYGELTAEDSSAGCKKAGV